MLTEWTLVTVKEALAAKAAETARTVELEVEEADVTSAVLIGVTAATAFDTLVWATGQRVVRSVDLGARRVTWQTPLLTNETLAQGDSVTLSNLPLAGAEVRIGGGPPAPRVVTVWTEQVAEEGKGLGRGYGARGQQVSGLAGVRRRFRPDDGFEDSGREFLRMVEQVCEVVAWGPGLEHPVALVTGIQHEWWVEGDGGSRVYVYDATVRFEVKARV